MSDERRSDSWGFMPEGRAREQRCFECGMLTTGRHHVVPKSVGGTKQIPLCADCHNLVHACTTIQPALIKAGIERKRQSGWKPGRPRKVTSDMPARAVALRAQGRTIKAIAAELGLSVGTICSMISGVQYSADRR